jgi:hypothetical protein
MKLHHIREHASRHCFPWVARLDVMSRPRQFRRYNHAHLLQACLQAGKFCHSIAGILVSRTATEPSVGQNLH